ncbi:MAG: hypothetical protein K9M19_06550 [Candidatus Marinimicrobia bacterium]|nr:hypothetical protein [Candidatus Neomarinimicrobiota bacterium]
MKKLLLVILLIWGCNSDHQSFTEPPTTAMDDFNDVTYLNGFLYTTNYDYSEGPGPRIFLYGMSPDGALVDRIDLSMNSQGFIFMTNDGQSIFGLCTPGPGLLAQWNSVGERQKLQSWDWPTQWAPGGIFFQADRSLAFVMFTQQHSVNITSLWELQNGEFVQSDTSRLAFAGASPIAATADSAGSVYILGEMPSGQRFVRQFVDLMPHADWLLTDSTITGITWADTALIALSRDRYIQRIPTVNWTPVSN